MNNGFMADPIRPGDMNQNKDVPTVDYSGRNKNNNWAGAALIVLFVIPMILICFEFLVFNLTPESGLDEALNEQIGTTNYEHYYELTDDQQMSVARIFGTGILFSNEHPINKIKQSDCRHFKNAVVSYYNQEHLNAEWYDNTFCQIDKVYLSTYFVDETESKLGGKIARIDMGSRKEDTPCMNVAFVDNFRYIVAAKKTGSCRTYPFSISADDIDVPEVEAEYTDDDDATDDGTMDDNNGGEDNIDGASNYSEGGINHT